MLGAKYAPLRLQAAHERVQSGYPGQSLGVSHDIHGAGMCASGHDEQAFSTHLDDDRQRRQRRRGRTGEGLARPSRPDW
jgi:hypothetical protein